MLNRLTLAAWRLVERLPTWALTMPGLVVLCLGPSDKPVQVASTVVFGVSILIAWWHWVVEWQIRAIVDMVTAEPDEP